MGNLNVPHLERVVYICTCSRGKRPHIHWDFFRNEPETVDHPEPWPSENSTPGVPVSKDK